MAHNLYESDELLQQYLIFHYASAEQQFPYAFGAADALDFPRRCVTEGLDPALLGQSARGLDVGCAVGRSSFELARHCREVIGIDYSQAFIASAKRMQAEGTHAARRSDEGSAATVLDLALDDAIDLSRVHFETGDAQALRQDLGQFDVVLACNLICRLAEPLRFLNRLKSLVRPCGQLLITTPFTWLESYTPPANWLGDGGQDSFAGLRASLAPDFDLQRQWNMPFLIREHARKFQYSIAQASRWRRR